jgi:hypothetical protein
MVLVAIHSTGGGGGGDYFQLARNGAMVYQEAGAGGTAASALPLVCNSGDVLQVGYWNSAGSTSYATEVLGLAPSFAVVAA